MEDQTWIDNMVCKPICTYPFLASSFTSHIRSDVCKNRKSSIIVHGKPIIILRWEYTLTN